MNKPERTTRSEPKWVYVFAAGYVDGRASMTELLGGKGANLAEMASLGLARASRLHYHHRRLQRLLRERAHIARGPEAADRQGATGSSANRSARSSATSTAPLLVSVRSGCTRLDARHDGHDPQPRPQRRDGGGPRHALGKDRRFAYDSYRRFIQMYADVVLGVDHGVFEDILENFKNLNGLTSDTELSRRRLGRDHRGVQGRGRARARQAVPAGHDRAALGRHRGGVRLLAERARQDLSAPARHSR